MDVDYWYENKLNCEGDVTFMRLCNPCRFHDCYIPIECT